MLKRKRAKKDKTPYSVPTALKMSFFFFSCSFLHFNYFGWGEGMGVCVCICHDTQEEDIEQLLGVSPLFSLFESQVVRCGCKYLYPQPSISSAQFLIEFIIVCDVYEGGYIYITCMYRGQKATFGR